MIQPHILEHPEKTGIINSPAELCELLAGFGLVFVQLPDLRTVTAERQACCQVVLRRYQRAVDEKDQITADALADVAVEICCRGEA